MRFHGLILATAVTLCGLGYVGSTHGQPNRSAPTKGLFYDAFRQLDNELPAPSAQRLASGAPGPGYWQQRADYKIKAAIDEATDTLNGDAQITYTNNSPHALAYLWVHLDQNRFAKHSAANRSRAYTSGKKLSFSSRRIFWARRRLKAA